MSFNALQVLALLQYLLVLRLTGDYPRQGENSDGDHDQQTDDHAEDVKEVGVLLAHVWIRVERLVNRRRSIDQPGELRPSSTKRGAVERREGGEVCHSEPNEQWHAGRNRPLGVLTRRA